MRTPLLIPSDQQSVYIMSMTDYNPGIWLDESQTRIGMCNRKNGLEPIKDTYTWDMHRLASVLPTERNGSGFNTISSTSQFWNPFLVNSYSDDAGANIFEPLETHFAVAPFTHSKASGHVFDARMQSSPLVPLYEGGSINISSSLNYLGEEKLYEAVVYPAMPMLIGTTTPASRSYGPVFLSSASFSVTGSGNLSPVQISADWKGGKIIRSPLMPPNAFFDGDISTRGYANEYRTATMMDCGFDTTVQLTPDDLALSMSSSRYWDYESLVGMKLSIQQNVKFEYTCQSKKHRDEHGPRFVSVSNRIVKGEVTFTGRDREALFEGMTQGASGSVTMYFGGPFLFPMQNVDWNKPTTSLNPHKTYDVTYSFVARACDYAVTKGFVPATAGYPTSEFYITTGQ